MIKLDSHIDTLYRMYKSQNLDLTDREDLDVDMKKLKRGGVNVCFFAIWLPKSTDSFTDIRTEIFKQYEFFKRIVLKNPSLAFAASSNDIQHNVDDGKVSALLGLENGVSIGEHLNTLNCFDELGVRYITLCHNYNNHLCDSSTDNPSYNNGLSDFGKRVVRRMNELGIMIDISHLSDKSAEEVLDYSQLPVIASHSGCYAIHKDPRNMDDRLLKKLASNGGVIQLTLLPKCVGHDYDIPSFINHIVYTYNLIGIDHIGIGSDFDGGGYIKGCIDIGQVDNITTALRQKHFKEDEIEKIWGLNFMRVFNANHKGG